MHRRYDKPIRERGQITVGRRRMATGQHGEPPEVSDHDCTLRPTRRLGPGLPCRRGHGGAGGKLALTTAGLET